MSRIRKALFGGMTIMLVAVLVWLIIQGRREEAKATAAPNEVVKMARSSSTRIVAPKDLQVAVSADAGQADRSLGRVEIHNRGAIAYHNILLKFSYIGAGGRGLDTQTQLVQGTIEPGQNFYAGRISTDTAPAGTIRCNVSILYSELGAAPEKRP